MTPLQAQPEVANNTGSLSSDVSSTSCSSEGQAVDQTPPDVGETTSGGCNDFPKMMVDQDGAVYIRHPRRTEALRFSAQQAEAIYDFLALTERVWRS